MTKKIITSVVTFKHGKDHCLSCIFLHAPRNVQPICRLYHVSVSSNEGMKLERCEQCKREHNQGDKMDHYVEEVYRDMIGQIFDKVIATDYEMSFLRSDGNGFQFAHQQDCCENVYIEDIEGDLEDLVGSPLLQAELVGTKEPDDSAHTTGGSRTWSFYKFATIKGYVTVRWLGESNGYYSETVDRFEIKGMSK